MSDSCATHGDQAIIIGAGPAGLAVGACLSRRNVPFIMLERENGVGASWRGHYDRLHLHTSKGTSALPFLQLPRHYPRYPSRAQVLDYIQSYARSFALEPRYNEEVLTAVPRDSGWQVRTCRARYRAPHLVISTGQNREPVVPQWPNCDRYRGVTLHASDYRNGARFSGSRVLVVGFGNSGAELALDLYEYDAEPAIAVRGPVNILPRDVFGVPIVRLAALFRLLPPPVADTINAPLLRLLVGSLRAYGLQPLPFGPLTQISRLGRIPMIDVGTLRLIRAGRIVVRPGIARFVEEGVLFTDGRRVTRYWRR